VSEQPSTAIQPFVHLSVHTEFSLVDSTVRIKPFAKQVAQSMAAAAVTDRDNLFALVKYYRAASAAGIKPIAGVDLRVRGMAQDDELTRVILLVQNNTGYLNLTNLVSRGYQEGQSEGTPVVNSDWIFDAHEGLIVLSGALEGDVGRVLVPSRCKPAWGWLQPTMYVFLAKMNLKRTKPDCVFKADTFWLIHAAPSLSLSSSI